MQAKTDTSRQNGQSLVELALVLPALCFSVMVIVQLVVFCRNQLEMQRMAQYCSGQIAPTTRAGRVLYTQFNNLWGHYTPPYLNRTPESLTTWRHYRGISTVHQPAQLMIIDVQSYLLPGVIARSLGITPQHATSLGLREPPAPGDKS